MMKYPVRLAASLLLLSGCVASLAARESRPRQTDPAFPVRHGEIITRYLPQEDRTVVMIRKMMLGSNFCEPLLIAEFSYEGRRPQAAADVALGFISNRFRGRELIFIADGEQIALGRLTQMAFHQGNICRQAVHRAGVLIPRATFSRIVKAKRIEVRVGDDGVPFTEEHIGALRELAGRMNQ